MAIAETTEKRSEKVKALQGWHQAKEEAMRFNRNLLQYAASIAAVFGIAAGSSGILAVADSLARTGEENQWVLAILAVIGLSLVITALLAVLLVDAFRRRGAAEREVGNQLARLIRLDPDHFMPAKEA